MKRYFTLLCLLCLFSSSQLFAQRYLEEVFDDVDVTTDVMYGVNATVLAYPLFGEAVPEPLMMDVYEPMGDTETSRPLILYFHTGNFLPHPENGSPSGLRTDSATVELCTRFAKMGYVVASCDYRLGWNPIAETQEERVFTLINAAYRGVQDSRTAARFFRMDAIDGDNSYGVDPEKVVCMGQGTGGYIALAAAALDEYEEILIDKFIGEDDEGNPVPMVIEFINGDIYGTSVGINPLDGDTLCYPNHVGYDSDFQAAINLGGAMGDISWYEEGEIPIISFHAPTDPFAPYEEGIVIVPVLNLPVVEVHGSYTVQETAAGFDNNFSFANTQLDDPYTMAADAINDGFDGLYPLIRPEGAEADSAPWEWWDSETNPNNDAGLATNPDMSPEKGRMFCDTIQWYIAPRLACALDLPENPCIIPPPANNECMGGIDINYLFGQPLGESQLSDVYNNENANNDGDPADGWDCFLEPDGNGDAPSNDMSVWFTFEGDGGVYNMISNDCDGAVTDTWIDNGDTQFALYSGPDCDNLTPVNCNDDSPDADVGNYFSEMDFPTEDGTIYWLLVDGFDWTAIDETVGVADGDFCLEITAYDPDQISDIENMAFRVYPNPADDILYVSSEEMIESIMIHNLIGELVSNDAISQTNQVEIDLSQFEAGVYTVNVVVNGVTGTQRVVVK